MDESKPHSAANETDPETLARLLELELMQKRAGWAQAKSRRNVLRAISFLFLFLVILGALVLYLLYFHPERGNELGTTPSGLSSPAASPSANAASSPL